MERGQYPKFGEVWPEADRKLWLDLLEGSFKLIYKDKPSTMPPSPGNAEYRKKNEAANSGGLGVAEIETILGHF
jgi:hypothetical protein